ncbi:MAG TPA: Stk1 family PASTA domain-containing Ser/Thr kinase [Gaiellaceae bacterium]|nr:Stk1 family PASTA domain-containing Ser/Thr kinase [Gaiellaceae bacterium]
MAVSDALIGSLFDGRYHVLRKLGAGGMANVYLAEDQELGRRVAIKILNERHANDEQFVERFRREAKNAAGLSHPSIVSIYDRGEAEGTYYIAMEYLEGRSLKELIVSRGPAPVNVAIEYARQILQALRFAHLKGIVHRDIKPHNVLVDGDGRLKVTDFGIARAGTSQMTEAGSIVGTAQYLSPEQARGSGVDQRSDVYSLGVVLYELLTGDVPFSGDTPVEIAMKHLSQTPEPPSALRPEVPHDLDLVVMRALAKNPDDRYQSAEEMEADLARVARGAGVSPETEESATMIMRTPMPAAGPTAATAATMITRPQRGMPPPGAYYDYEEPVHRRPVWPWIAALLFVAAAAIGGWFVYHQISHQLASNAVVPVSNYEGLRKELAVSKVHSDGFAVKIDFQPNDTTPKDFVFAQDPSPGSRQARHSTVTITVSTGLPKVAVPALVGLQSTDAVAALAGAKLKWVIKEVNSNKPAGEVTGQDPKKDKQVVQGTTVHFNVSKGPTPVPIPSVVGEPIQTATSDLQTAGFQVRPTYVDSSQPANQVIQQTPKAGGTAAKGSVVAITVSKGPKTTTVPFVQSEDVGTATTDLQQSGFKVHIVNEPTTDPNQDGIVLSQTPAGGAQAKPGSTVTITVGRITNNTTTTTP